MEYINIDPKVQAVIDAARRERAKAFRATLVALFRLPGKLMKAVQPAGRTASI